MVSPLRRPALPMVAWAFPLALYPSKLFPCRQLVSRQSCLAPASRSVQEPQVNLDFPSLAKHCSRLARVTAVHSLSPLLTIRARLPGTIRERMVPDRSAVIGRSTSGLCSTVKSVTTR